MNNNNNNNNSFNIFKNSSRRLKDTLIYIYKSILTSDRSLKGPRRRTYIVIDVDLFFNYKNLSPAEVEKSCRLPYNTRVLRMCYTTKPVTLICRDFTPWYAYRARAGVFLKNCLPGNLILRPETSEQDSRRSPILSLGKVTFRMCCYGVAHHRAFPLKLFCSSL
jgi:hypothetical protein